MIQTHDKATDYRDRIALILADDTGSVWLKEAIRHNLKRDPLDAEVDARVLFELMIERSDFLRTGTA